MSEHMGKSDRMSDRITMGTGIYHGMKMGPDHDMPEGTAGGDGATFSGKPDLQAAISLVVAGGAPGNFSIVKALAALAGPKLANAEVAKLTKQTAALGLLSTSKFRTSPSMTRYDSRRKPE